MAGKIRRSFSEIIFGFVFFVFFVSVMKEKSSTSCHLPFLFVISLQHLVREMEPSCKSLLWNHSNVPWIDQQDSPVKRLAKDLVQHLGDCARTSRMRLESPVEDLTDASNVLKPNFGVQAIYTELLHAAIDDTERFESKKKSDQLGDLSKCYACRMTGKHVSFMKGKSRPPQAIRLCLALPAAWMPLVVECSHANSHVDLTCHAAALTQIQIFQRRTNRELQIEVLACW